ALREEAVAGMDRLRAAVAGLGDDAVDVEVAARRRAGPDLHVLIGERDVERAGVGRGVDGHGLEPQIAGGADDAHGDLAAVRDEHAPHASVPTETGHRRGSVAARRRRRSGRARRRATVWAGPAGVTPRPAARPAPR